MIFNGQLNECSKGQRDTESISAYSVLLRLSSGSRGLLLI